MNPAPHFFICLGKSQFGCEDHLASTSWLMNTISETTQSSVVLDPEKQTQQSAHSVLPLWYLPQPIDSRCASDDASQPAFGSICNDYFHFQPSEPSALMSAADPQRWLGYSQSLHYVVILWTFHL